ncbi:MAG: hypothetical protein ACTSSN_06055 [Candidatus Heimdallarchaeaceae archaeon]
MKKSNLILNAAILVFFVASFNSINSFTSAVVSADSINLPDYSLDTDLTLCIHFFGYDNNILNLTEIGNMLNSEFNGGYQEIGSSNINFDFVFSFATETEYEQLEDYINSIKVNGTGVGYSLNVSQLIDDLATGDRNDILIPENGSVMDARLVENYLYENFYEENIENPGYTMFLLNFTSLDSLVDNQEHWYKVVETGFDSNITIDYWFSGYSDIPYVPTLGWGGSERFCFLDLSARTWYYDWLFTAWGFPTGDYSYYTYSDLDALAQNVSLYGSEGKTILSTYLADYINSYLGNVFSAYYGVNPIGESYSMQVKVFNNLTEAGYTLDELNWVISETRIFSQLEIDFPWIDWIIDVQYVDLIDYPSLSSWISSNLQQDQDGDYIEVANGFYQLLETQLSLHFDYTAADSILPCYFFLTDDIQFRWYGTAFAGLGGMGWELLVNNQYSMFENGISSLPRRGMSAVMFHELGHSLGIPHPHGGTHGWGSSFIEDVMNYFSIGESSFSSFYKDGLARAHNNYWYSLASGEMDSAFLKYIDAGSIDKLLGMVNDIYILLGSAAMDFQDMNYTLSIEKAKLARSEIETLVFYIDNPDQIPTTPTNRTASYASLLVFVSIIISSVLKKKKRN